MARILRKKPETRVEESFLTVMSSSFGTETEDRKVLDVHEFKTDPAYVRVSAGVTKATAPYESLRVDVAVTIPCYVEEIEDVKNKAAEAVSRYLDEELGAYLGEQD